jgi:signal transduction histidine kinase
MTKVEPSFLSDLVSDIPLASPEELERQAAFFNDAFLTRHLLDAMPGMVLVLNNYRQIVFANRAFNQLSGKQETEPLVGLLVGDVLQCHVAINKDTVCGTTESCEACGALVAMLSGLSGVDSIQECTLTQHDGLVTQHLTLRVWSAPLRFGEEEFVVLAGTDVSHERRRLALERTFFHDILNLVASIQGFAELMEIDESVDPMMVSRRIQSASQKVIEEIDAQRVLLAVEKGELKVDNHVMTSLDVLKDVIELYEGREVSRKRMLKIDDDVIRTSFISDATLLRRILGNMVKNALEASPEGYTVTLGVDKSAAGLSFWVHNATVISASYHQRIFQRDFSTKGSGRGLGTYSMKLLGRFLSGDVSFESSPEGGTRFTLSLPDVCSETA